MHSYVYNLTAAVLCDIVVLLLGISEPREARGQVHGSKAGPRWMYPGKGRRHLYNTCMCMFAIIWTSFMSLSSLAKAYASFEARICSKSPLQLSMQLKSSAPARRVRRCVVACRLASTKGTGKATVVIGRLLLCQQPVLEYAGPQTLP